MTAKLNSFLLNTSRLNNGTAVPSSYKTEMGRLQDSKPITKVEFIEVGGTVTDITAYYIDGARFDQVKDRASGEIQAGDFDINLHNTDNYFSEFDPLSFLYNKQYHGAKIRISMGFILPDGTTVYETQGTGFIDQLVTNDNPSYVTFRCRDRIGFLLDGNLNVTPSGETPVAGSNTGNGSVSFVAVKPFKTKNENWTLTCTTPGGDGTAKFSVVGSVTGSIGPATSGTEFSTLNAAGGLKFTITAGSTPWSLNDSFTFSTKQFPEWSAVNAGKIIWAILTGYNWDTDTQEAWSAQVFSFDHTKSTANPDLNYTDFLAAIADIDAEGVFNLTGYIERDQLASDALTNLIILFLGAIHTDGDGKFSLRFFLATFGTNIETQFADSKKIKNLTYNRNIDEVINYVVVNYKKIATYEFSDQEIVYTGSYVKVDATSRSKYKTHSFGHGSIWYTVTGAHVQDMADKMIARYAEPPLNIDFYTGADALQSIIGDVVGVTDLKYNFSKISAELIHITKNLDARPIEIAIRARRDSSLAVLFGYLGSSVDEGDGLSPQAADYDSASVNDKAFCYLGDGVSAAPDYRMF